MSYTSWNESGNYIYGGMDYVDFNGTTIPDNELTAAYEKAVADEQADFKTAWENY